MENKQLLPDEAPQEKEREQQELRTDLEKLRRKVDAADVGVFAKVSKWAGLLGLVISTALASTAIWDWAITARADRLAEDIARVDTILTELAKASTAVAQVPPQSPQYQAIAQNLNGLKIPLLDTAVATVNDIQKVNKSAISSGALLVLAYELGNQHRYTEAISIAKLASENTTSKAIELEARRLAASVAFQSLDSDLIAGARIEFETVVSEASQLQGFQGYLISSNAIRDWSVSEALLGNCEEARKTLQRFDSGFNSPGAKAIAHEGRTNALQLLAIRRLCQ